MMKTYLFRSHWKNQIDLCAASMAARGFVCEVGVSLTPDGAVYVLRADRPQRNPRIAQIMRDLRDAPLRPDQRGMPPTS
jgi:hypothetical protein